MVRPLRIIYPGAVYHVGKYKKYNDDEKLTKISDHIKTNMARKSRIDAPGALHHIIVRGIERRSIFVDAQDYQNFLNRLGNILTDSLTGSMPGH